LDNIEITDQQSKCLECNECCEFIEIPTTMFNNSVMEYYLARGTQFVINPAGILMIRIHEPCVFLQSDGSCEIYDNRPEVCRTYMCAVGDKSMKEKKDADCKSARIQVSKIIESEKLAKQTNKEG